MKSTFAMIAAALFVLTGCVVEDRVILHDSHPRPYYAPPPAVFWYGPPRHRHHHNRGYGYGYGHGYGHRRW